DPGAREVDFTPQRLGDCLRSSETRDEARGLRRGRIAPPPELICRLYMDPPGPEVLANETDRLLHLGDIFTGDGQPKAVGIIRGVEPPERVHHAFGGTLTKHAQPVRVVNLRKAIE